MLNIGDIIYSIVDSDTLTYDKGYVIVSTRFNIQENDSSICIVDDKGYNWWFGQLVYFESWDMWFRSEVEYLRDKKIDEICY